MFAAIFTYLPYRKVRRSEKILEQSFGADSFDSQQIKTAIEFYVDPDCSVFDSSGEDDIRHIVPNRTPLFATIDDFLYEKNEAKHILLLADSGMGKTSFLLNYYARNQRKKKKSQQRIAIIPLGRPDALTNILQIDNKKNTVLMLDAFDEDTAAIRDHKKRLQQLMESCADFKKIILTCRTQFFTSDEEIPKKTCVTIVGPRRAGQGGIYTFYKLYLVPFNDKQVQHFVSKRFPFFHYSKRLKALEIIKAIPELSVRPMLLAIVPELVDANRIVTKIYDLYQFMVESWLERESSWINKDTLRSFSELIATNIYEMRDVRRTERITPLDLSQLIQVEMGDIEKWILTSRSLLNRDSEGNYKFAHRSIMEYLYVTAFIKGRNDCLKVKWTDLMRELFISWANNSEREQESQVRALIRMSDFRVTQLFPLCDKGRKVCPQYSRVYHEWNPSFIIEKRIEDVTYFCDLSSDLLFIIPVDNRCGDLALMRLFQLTAVEVTHECTSESKWRAPTVDEFYILYVINEKMPFADNHGYYWTSDKSENGMRICVSFKSANEQVDNRLTKIGFQKMRRRITFGGFSMGPMSKSSRALSDNSYDGYSIFALKELAGGSLSGEIDNRLRGYLIRVYEGNAQDCLYTHSATRVGSMSFISSERIAAEKVAAERVAAEESNFRIRVICSDESCIGVIGSDGRCRVCGLPYSKVSEDQSPASEDLM